MPVGLLAVRGVANLAARAGPRRVAVVVAILLSPAAGEWVGNVVALAPYRLGLSGSDRRAYHLAADADTRNAAADAAFLREPGAPPGPILVIGPPQLQRESGRTAATAVHGWSTPMYLPELWARLARGLVESRGAYV